MKKLVKTPMKNLNSRIILVCALLVSTQVYGQSRNSVDTLVVKDALTAPGFFICKDKRCAGRKDRPVHSERGDGQEFLIVFCRVYE